MAEDLRLEMARDRSLFVTGASTHPVLQLQQMAAKEVALSDALARQKDLVARQQALVNRRREDIKLFEANLAALSKETADRLSEVRNMSDKLLEIRVATRNASEANQNYETADSHPRSGAITRQTAGCGSTSAVKGVRRAVLLRSHSGE